MMINSRASTSGSRKRRVRGAAIGVSAVLAAGGLATTQQAIASGGVDDSGHAEQSARAVPKANGADSPTYSGKEVLQLLVSGTGRAAETHPEVVKALGLPKGGVRVDSKEFDSFYADFTKKNPKFLNEVVPALQANDKVKARAGLMSYAKMMKAYTGSQAKQDGTSRGWFKASANVLVSVNAVAVANAAAYANVAAATFVVTVAAVVPSYLEDDLESGMGRIDRDAVASAVSKAASRS